MKRHITLCGLVLLAVCGCSKPSHPPRELSQLLTTADRVVATNRYDPFGITVTGEEVSRLADAVASAKQPRAAADAVFDCAMEFYSGTNFLASIDLQGNAFWLEDAEYRDRSGVLNAFYEKWLEEQRIARETDAQ